MGASLNDLSVLKDDDLVAVSYSGKPVGNEKVNIYDQGCKAAGDISCL